MGDFDTSYCTDADLRIILPTIADYDRKREVIGWRVEAGSQYKASSTGVISMLYE